MSKKEKIVFEEDFNLENVEDDGQAKITNIIKIVEGADYNDNDENGMYFSVISWDKEREHKDWERFEGRKIRITIETID